VILASAYAKQSPKLIKARWMTAPSKIVKRLSRNMGLRSFIASCKRAGVEPFAWFRDVLSRIAAHPITRLTELLPHNWKPIASTTQA
jgi:hypothetical protein